MKRCPACGHNTPDSAIHCLNCRSLLDQSAAVEGTRLFDTSEYSVEIGDGIDGRYKVVRLLGQGGMGEVYLVLDLLMDGEPCALKLIHPALMRSREARQRFRSEVTTSRRLQHPSIIKVYDMGHWKEQEQYYFIMEYIRGKTLAELLAGRQGQVPPFTLEEIGLVMEQLLQGLHYAHRYTIHRDIKPDNIMLKGDFPDATIKILDFGIARAMSASRLTQTAQGLGAPHYMAPEQMEDAHRIDQRADLYGVGMILYELLTGRRAMGRFKPLVDVVDSSYAPLDSVIDTALAPEPDDRYADAGAMLEGINAALAEIETSREKQETKQKQKEETELQERQKKEKGKEEQHQTKEEQPAGEESPEEEAGKKERAEQAEPGPEPPAVISGKSRMPFFAGAAVFLLVIGIAFFALRGGGGEPGQTVDSGTKQLAACEEHRRNHAWNQAETCYTEVLQNNPDEQRAKEGLTEVRSRLAAEKQKNAIEKKEKEIAGQLARCAELRTSGEYAKAHSCYTDVLQRDRANLEARSGLSTLYSKVLALGRQALEKGDIGAVKERIALLNSFDGATNSAGILQRELSVYEQKQAAEREKQQAEEQRKLAAAKKKQEEQARAGKRADLLGKGEQAIKDKDLAEARGYLAELVDIPGSGQEQAQLAKAIDALAARRAREEAAQKEKQEAEEKAARLANLLKQCASFLENRALTTPAGANALECYREVLALDGENKEARTGLERISATYLEWGKQALTNNNPARAEKQLAKLEGLDFAAAEQEELRAALAAYKEEQARKPRPGDIYTDPSTGMEFVYVPGGTFYMGQSGKEKKQIISVLSHS